MLVQQSNIGALEMLCGYGRVRVYGVILEHSGVCAGTAEY